MHAPFSASVGGETWLIYSDKRLKATGNSDLIKSGFASLDDGIPCTSIEMANAW